VRRKVKIRPVVQFDQFITLDAKLFDKGSVDRNREEKWTIL